MHGHLRSPDALGLLMWGLIMNHGQEGRVGWGLVAKGQRGCNFKCIFVITETKGINTLQVNKYIWFNSYSFVFLYAWKKTFLLWFLSFLLPSPHSIILNLSLLCLSHSLLFCYVMSLFVRKKKIKNFGGRDKNVIQVPLRPSHSTLPAPWPSLYSFGHHLQQKENTE